MRRTIGLLCALAGLLGCGPTLPPSADLEALLEVEIPAEDPTLPTAMELLTRHIEATGMRNTIGASSSVRIRGLAEVAELGVEGEFEALRARPSRSLLRMNLPSVGETVYGVDDGRGWMIHPMVGVQVFEGAARIKARQNAGYEHLLERPAGIEVYRTVGRKRFDRRDCYEVFGLLSDSEGLGLDVRERMFREYFEVESGLLAGVEEASDSTTGTVMVRSTFRDYTDLGGSLVAKRTVQSSPGFDLTLTVESVEYDVVPEDAFELPEQVAELLQSAR